MTTQNVYPKEANCGALEPFLEGGLPPHLRSDFLRHLRTCQLCRVVMDGRRGVDPESWMEKRRI